MSLIKIAAKILKSPHLFYNCEYGLLPNKETFLGIYKNGINAGKVHYFQKIDKNKIRHFTGALFGHIPKDLSSGSPFLGAVQEFTNKNAKRKLRSFDEIYRFKSPESAKRFRNQLREL
jgi:hypothetical protein